MGYLVRFVQKPSPPSTMKLEDRAKHLDYILKSDLGYTPLTRPRPLVDENGVPDPEREMERETWKMYELGQVTAAQYHHIVDRHYEELHGMQVRRRVGKMTETEKDVISSFVEEEPGEREERLRKEIEKDVGWGQDDFDQEFSLVDRQGEPVPLHPYDRRAVEFRERLRTFFLHAPWESLRKEHARSWLAWACFTMDYAECEEDEGKVEFIERTVKMLEARTGHVLPDGKDPAVKVMRLTLDPVNVGGYWITRPRTSDSSFPGQRQTTDTLCFLEYRQLDTADTCIPELRSGACECSSRHIKRHWRRMS